MSTQQIVRVSLICRPILVFRPKRIKKSLPGTPVAVDRSHPVVLVPNLLSETT